MFRSKIVTGEQAITKYREVIEQTKAEIATPKDTSNVLELQKFVVDLESRIAATETIIADIKAQLGE
ncbi:hypothetical protein ACFTAO_12765 [Paenibacillus rhizoplanae]